MFRKIVVASLMMALAIGSVFAEEVTGTFVKFADGKLTIKVKDEEKTYTVPKDLKYTSKGFGKDAKETEKLVSESLEKIKDSKFPVRVKLEVEKDEVKKFGFDRGMGKVGKDKAKTPDKDKAKDQE